MSTVTVNPQFTDTPKIGVDLRGITVRAANKPAEEAREHRLLSKVWGTDGMEYIYAEASGAIAASAAAVTVNMTTGKASSGGGTAVSPNEAMVAGDEGWFKLVPAAPAP